MSGQETEDSPSIPFCISLPFLFNFFFYLFNPNTFE